MTNKGESKMDDNREKGGNAIRCDAMLWLVVDYTLMTCFALPCFALQDSTSSISPNPSFTLLTPIPSTCPCPSQRHVGSQPATRARACHDTTARHGRAQLQIPRRYALQIADRRWAGWCGGVSWVSGIIEGRRERKEGGKEGRKEGRGWVGLGWQACWGNLGLCRGFS